MTIVEALFVISIGMISYAYLGYPCMLWCLQAMIPKPGGLPPATLPKVSLLISAYNEEASIRQKLINSLELDYPRSLVEIIVISDGSTDSTDVIVGEFAQEGVILKSYKGRIGKTACLNQAITSALGEIVIFSDANSMYPQHVVRALTRPFGDPAIGFVTGGTSYVAEKNGQMGESMGLYARLERMTKLFESRLGSCVGADGAMFAIRRSLYEPLEDADINDLVIPLRIVMAGYRGVYAAEASCIEVAAKETTREFSRQVRIAARTIRAVLKYRRLLNPLSYGFFSFQLISHKLCKLVVPFFLLAALVTNIVLVGAGSLYLVMLAVQAVAYVTAWMATRNPVSRASDSGIMRAVDVIHSFIVVNAAVGVAWARYWKGDSFTTWVPAR